MPSYIRHPTTLGRADRAGALTEREMLILRGYRQWLMGLQRNDTVLASHVWNDMARTLGPERGRQAMAALIGTVATLVEGAQRTLRYHHPCCPCLGADEVSILTLVGAAAHGEPRLAHVIAQDLVGADRVGDLLMRAGHLAAALGQDGADAPRRIDAWRLEPVLDGPSPMLH